MQQNHTAPSTRPTAPRPGATALDAFAAASISPDGRVVAPASPRKITTEEAAERMRNRPQTWRAAYCRDGHFHGLIPVKLPSRRLLWDADEVDALIAGETVKTPDAAQIDAHAARKAAAADKVRPHILAKAEARAERLLSGEGA